MVGFSACWSLYIDPEHIHKHKQILCDCILLRRLQRIIIVTVLTYLQAYIYSLYMNFKN